jgi:hypothetical protein
METKKLVQPMRIEPRWPVALNIVVVLFVLALTPARVQLFPSWLPYVVGTGLLLPVVFVWMGGARPWMLRIERVTVPVFSLVALAAILTTLIYLMLAMLQRPESFSGRQLLTSSLGAWVANVMMFSLLYWRMDRGGPEARANDVKVRPDWIFPQTGAPEEAPPDWRPTYVDYLFLSFTTATAFSTTDVIPMTSRAKMLMMLESAISLSTLVVVASRAINILGS